MTRNNRTDNYQNRPAWPLWLLIADAAVYWAALYYCARLTFFFRDGVIGGGMRLAGPALVVAVVMLGLAAKPYLGQRWKHVLFMDAAAFLFIGAWLPWKFSGVATAKGLSFAWAAIEWMKLPGNVLLMFRIDPITFVVFWCVVIGLVWFMNSGRRAVPASIIVVFSALYSVQLLGMEAGVRLPAYFFFVIALIAALVAGVRGHLRAFARLLIIDSTFLLIFLFYVGVIPVVQGPQPGADAGFRRIYPAQGARAEFPLKFLRDMHAEPSAGYLYTAYGPTSGIVRVDIKSGRADIVHNPGIVRVLWTRPEMKLLYALDWQYADFYRIRKKDFKILSKIDIHDHVLITPMSYVVEKGKLYVVSTDLPALTRFDLKTMKKEARIDFRKQKLTGFRSGAWKCVADRERGKLFVEMGPVDLRGRYRMVRVDLETFTVEKTAYLPEGGLELTLVPWANEILVPAFFSEKIYVLNRDTLEVKRTLTGPLTCRNLVPDSQRRVLYATSYTRGDLMAIEFRTGKILSRVPVGRKPSSLAYDPDTDKLFLGSGRGIFEISVKKFLSEKR